MVSIRGAEAHLRRLKRIRSPAMAAAVTRALYAGAQDVQVTAQLKITEGAVSGRNHQASAPGESPNNDTGVLAGNIEAAVVGTLKAETSSNAPYAAAQELGSQSNNLEERPYMRPAAAEARPRVVALVVKAVDRIIRSG